MTTSLRELRQQADSVAAPELDVADLVRRGEARRRRRRRGLVGGVAAVVLVAVAGVGLATRGAPESQPVFDRPHRDDSNPAPKAVQRRLTYADWRYGTPTTQVHVGSSVVEVPVPLSWLDVTDDGALVTTAKGRIFFTDGDSVEEIGTLGFDTNSYRAGGLVRSGHTGSLAAWFDSSDPRAPVLVVYDTALRRVVARHPVPRCRLTCSTQVLVGDHVYWSDQWIAYGQTDLRGASVFDLSTGTDSPGSPDSLEDDVRASGRGVVVGRSPTAGQAVLSTTFTATEGHLVQDDGRAVFDLATGVRLDLRVPPGIADGAGFDLVQWLDDGRFVLRGGAVDGYVDNLFVCTVERQACRQAAPTIHAETTRRVVNDRIINM
jgi:hypothetical protein